MTIKLAVFDMAGTTVADKGDIIAAFKNSFAKNGIEVNAANLQTVRGLKKTSAIKIILEKFRVNANDRLIKKIHEDFISSITGYYRTSPDVAVAPGAEEVFIWLKKKEIRVALNTGFSKEVADAIVNRFQWMQRGLIDEYISSDDVEEGRPHPFMIQQLMKNAGTKNTNEVAKIGDTIVDIEEGRNAGCGLVIGITIGASSRKQLELSNPDHVIDRLSELKTLIH